MYQLSIIKNNKKRLNKKARERYQNLSKEEKEKSNKIVLNDTKIYKKMENEYLLSIEQNIKE